MSTREITGLAPPGDNVETRSCYACGGIDWKLLPSVGDHALISDGHTVNKPLRKMTCMQCGLARSTCMPSANELKELFSNNYELYAHAVGEAFESARQKHYADWIAEILRDASPERIFEVGCGNGSLLHSLRRHFPRTILSGIEPSAAAVEFAKDAGLDVQQGLFDETAASKVHTAVILSVNVIEHVNDPLAFLRAARITLPPRGAGLFICPDGDRVSSELLIYDHLHSFSRCSIYRLFSRAGLHVQRICEAPASLGAFMAIFFSLSPHAGLVEVNSHVNHPDVLQNHRYQYLRNWQRLDDLLLGRARPYRELVCFGIGEAAHLLATYAPGIWARVAFCTADNSTTTRFREKQIAPYDRIADATNSAMLLGVRPGSQGFLADRLGRDGYKVIRWDDIVAE